MTEINPLDMLAIKNVVSRYCQALDSKDYDMLGQVFVPDVEADYPFNSNMKSLDEVKDAIKNRYLTHRSCETSVVIPYLISPASGQFARTTASQHKPLLSGPTQRLPK